MIGKDKLRRDKPQYYTLVYRRKGDKEKLKVDILARNKKELQREANRLGYVVISTKRQKQGLNF